MPDVQDGQNLGQVGPRQMFKMDEIWGKSEKKADLQTLTSGTNLQNPPEKPSKKSPWRTEEFVSLMFCNKFVVLILKLNF